MFSIYALWSGIEDNIRYVSCTTIAVEKRLKQHLTTKLSNTHKERWIAKCIANDIQIGFTILEIADSKDEMLRLEVEYIKILREEGFNLTNSTDGGDFSTYQTKMSEETRRKMSERAKGRASGFKGRKHTEEAKNKNRLAHLKK